MATKERALACARGIHAPSYIYRVGSQWMFTSEAFHIVQRHYKVPLRDWTIVKPLSTEAYEHMKMAYISYRD